MKFDIRVFFETLSRKCGFLYNLTRITGILREDLRTFVTGFRSVLLKIRNFSGKLCK